MEWVIFFIIIGIFSVISNSKESRKHKRNLDKKTKQVTSNDIENSLQSIKRNKTKTKITKNDVVKPSLKKNDNPTFDKNADELQITLTPNIYLDDMNKNDIDHLINKNKSYEEKILDKFQIVYIYHMTHINNLYNILNYGLLSHDNNEVNNKIDNPEVNNRRNFNEPIYHKNVHDYVPFYFNPKNAMLYVNKENQGNLVILAFDNHLIYEQGSLFTDGNASVNNTAFYNNINDLDKLAWDCIHANTWFNFNDGKRTKMSEVLVPNKVGINKLKKIYCINYHIKSYIDNLMINYPNIKVEVNTEIFF